MMHGMDGWWRGFSDMQKLNRRRLGVRLALFLIHSQCFLFQSPGWIDIIVPMRDGNWTEEYSIITPDCC